MEGLSERKVEKTIEAAAEGGGGKRSPWPRLAALAVFVAAVAAVFVFDLDQYLSWQALRDNREALLGFVGANYLPAVALFVAVYVAGTAFSVPGAVWLSIAGGFLFGPLEATLYIVAGATGGATIVFLLARFVFGEGWKAKAGRAVRKMEAGFRENAFSYLLVLRLIPVFPFWVVNLVPAFLGVRASTYVIATFIGIIPGAFVYATVGNGLNAVFEAGGRPDLSIIFDIEVLGPILGLAGLSLLPVAYKTIKGRKPGAVDPGKGETVDE